jgi:FkbM family methyltransferase
MRQIQFLNNTLYLHPQGDVVCDNIAKGIPSEYHLVQIFEQYIKPDFIIVEGGAHVGIHTIRFSTLANKGLIYSFEASHRNYNLLKNTLEVNNIKNVYLENKALYSKKDTVFINESFAPDQDSITQKNTGLPIESVSIDSLNLSKVDFIKLDIEGGEADAFKGAIDTIKNHKPIITFEYLKHKNVESPIPILLECGYDVFNMEGHWDYLALPR